jgi:RNA methyltransferase, TrmH family
VHFSPPVSSTRHPLIRHVARLRDNRFRQRDAAVLVDGSREIELALASGLTLRSLLIAESKSDAVQSLVAAAGPAVVWVTPTILGHIGYGDHPRDVVAVFDAPTDRTLDAFKLPPNPLIVILVGVEKPGNAGAIFRTADAVGADAVILCRARCDLFNPNLIRSSLGTVFSMPSAQAGQSETIRWLGQQNIRPLAAIVGAEQSFWQVDYRGPTAIVLGSEQAGLDDAWRPGRSLGELTAVSIPMLGAADSLNVSVTAAALLFEARRQRVAVAH